MIADHQQLIQGIVLKPDNEMRYCLGPKKGSYNPGVANVEQWSDWDYVPRYLIGHKILGADLMHREFRRRLI